MLTIATPAFGAIKITKIAFDPAGRDSGTNSHLNKEFVVIKNTGSRTKNLTGWKLLDRGPDLGSGEAMTFMAAKMLGTMDSTITVKWREGPAVGVGSAVTGAATRALEAATGGGGHSERATGGARRIR